MYMYMKRTMYMYIHETCTMYMYMYRYKCIHVHVYVHVHVYMSIVRVHSCQGLMPRILIDIVCLAVLMYTITVCDAGSCLPRSWHLPTSPLTAQSPVWANRSRSSWPSSLTPPVPRPNHSSSSSHSRSSS